MWDLVGNLKDRFSCVAAQGAVVDIGFWYIGGISFLDLLLLYM